MSFGSNAILRRAGIHQHARTIQRHLKRQSVGVGVSGQIIRTDWTDIKQRDKRSALHAHIAAIGKVCDAVAGHCRRCVTQPPHVPQQVGRRRCNGDCRIVE